MAVSKSEQLQVPAKLAFTIIGVLLTAAISFNAWAVAAVYERPTKEEVKELIRDKSPYIAERALILKTITEASENYKELKRAIDTNTRAVIELQAQLSQSES